MTEPDTTAPARSAKDYVIEFGEYLAKAAEDFMAEQNRAAKADETPNSESWSSLKNAIYEFRKRADKAGSRKSTMSSDNTTKALTWNRQETHRSGLEKGEFCYSRHENGAVKWVHFWPWDSPCALSAAINPQRNGGGATWSLSGTDDAPTLLPSVNAVGIWHGHLTNGVAKQ